MNTFENESLFRLLIKQLSEGIVNSLRPAIREEIRYLVENQQKKEQQRYISSEKAKEMLDVCDSSLWRWTKKGLLTKKKISGRTYYDRTEIEGLLNNPM